MTLKFIFFFLLSISLQFPLFSNSCNTIFLNSQLEVDAFQLLDCDSISGDLIIHGFDINNLDSIIGLKFVSGNLLIDSTSILSLDGLDSITHVGIGLDVVSCFVLSNINALDHLKSTLLFRIEYCAQLQLINLDFIDSVEVININNNPSLKVLRIANNVRDMQGTLNINNNELLDSIFAIKSVVNLLFMSISGNDSLKHIHPFQNLVFLGNLDLISNNNLSEITCFPELRIVNGHQYSHLSIQFNEALSTVHFPKLKFVSEMYIQENPSLNNCCFISCLVRDGGLARNFIESNDSLCNNLRVIITSCSEQDIDDDNIPEEQDNCPNVYNLNQADYDSDGVGNACDNCPTVSNQDQADTNFDGIGDLCSTVYNSRIGLHTNNPVAGVQIDSSDVYIEQIQRGLILRNFLGECFRISVDEFGQIKVTSIECPN